MLAPTPNPAANVSPVVLWTDHSYPLCMTAGRPISYDTEQVISRATQVFRARGYTGTSMADLLDATRLSRSSLYQAFAGKEALFLRCLQHYCDEFAAQLSADLRRASGGREFIEQTFHRIARGADDPAIREGCLAMNTAIELGNTDCAPARQAEQGLQRFARIFRRAIEQAQQEGTIANDRNAGDLAQYLVSSMCGLRMLIKSGRSAADVERIVDLILRGLGR